MHEQMTGLTMKDDNKKRLHCEIANAHNTNSAYHRFSCIQQYVTARGLQTCRVLEEQGLVKTILKLDHYSKLPDYSVS